MATSVTRTPTRRTNTKTIRVRTAVHEKLRAMAVERQTSIGALLDDLVEEHRKHTFLAQVERDFRRLRADPEASAAYDAELADWDVVLMDGLEDAPWEVVDGSMTQRRLC